MTTVRTQYRASAARVVFDGQSLNAAPINHTYPRTMMTTRFAGVPWNNLAIGATSWTKLSLSRSVRINLWAPVARYAILVMCGGTSDILAPGIPGGDGDNAATVYADFGAYADNARASGYDYVIASTITPDEFGFDSTQETTRQTANSLILADASTKFDAVCDFAGDARIGSIPHNPTYMDTDGLHPLAAGADVMVELMAPYVAAALAKAAA